MQPDRKETPAERVIKCALPEYCLCKRLKNSPKTQDMYGKISVKFRGQRLTFYAKSDTHLFNRMLQQLPKNVPTLRRILVTPVWGHVCPSLSNYWALTSKWMENFFWKMTQHFRDPAPGWSSNHSVEARAWKLRISLWMPPPPYIHHTFKMNQWNSHKTRMRWWHDRITRESVS